MRSGLRMDPLTGQQRWEVVKALLVGTREMRIGLHDPNLKNLLGLLGDFYSFIYPVTNDPGDHLS